MGWQKIAIERTKLYEEVWNDPMTKVAKVYGLSDVLLRRLEEQSLRSKLERDIAQQRELDRRMKSEEWEQRKAEKDALLNRLAGFEKMAHDLDRAESLRRLGERIRASSSAAGGLDASLEQLTLMANWLDPLVKAAWPEVDEVPGKNPYASRW